MKNEYAVVQGTEKVRGIDISRRMLRAGKQ